MWGELSEVCKVQEGTLTSGAGIKQTPGLSRVLQSQAETLAPGKPERSEDNPLPE